MSNSWNQFKNAIGSTTARGSASSYSGDPAFDAWQRYRSEVYGDEFEESEKERKRREKELARLNKKKDEFAIRGAEGVKKWGDDALGEDKEEIVPDAVKATRRASEEAARLPYATRPAVQITAGAAQSPQKVEEAPRYANPYEEPASEEQVNKDNLEWLDRAKARIEAEHDSKHSLGGRKAEAAEKLKELGSQADDGLYFSMDDSNDNKLLSDLNKKINSGRVLTPDEEVAYSEAKVRGMYKKYDGLKQLMDERNAYYSVYNDYVNGNDTSGRAKYAQYTAQDKLNEAEAKIKKLTGWSDEEMKANLQYADRIIDRQNTQAVAQRYAIDNNASTMDKIGEGLKNTAYSLTHNGAVANLNSIYNDYNEERPRGFGANIDDPSHRLVRNSNNAVAATRQRVADDLGETAGKAYDIAYSAADSLAKRVPAMLATMGLGKVVGEAAGLVPYALSAYNSGYQEARERGATEAESRASGITQGAIETLTEILPVGNAVSSVLGKNAGKSVVKEFTRMIVEEGAEEAVGDLANEIADAIIFNDDPEVQNKFQKRIEETGSVGGAIWDLAKEMGYDFLSGALSSVGMSGVNVAVQNSNFNKASENIKQGASQMAEEIQGTSEYEQSAKAQMEQYAKNPTRYIADNLAENTDEDKQRKKRAMEIANKEANGEKVTLAEKMFINDAIAASEESNEKQAKKDKKEGKVVQEEDDSNIPIEYRNKLSNVTEDEARVMLAKAAKNGDTDAFIDAIQMTRNSSNKEVADNAEQIIGEYSGMAQSHGITAEAIGQARISRLEAYKAGLEGENLTNLSDKNQIAYNEGQKARIENEARTNVQSVNAEISTKDGRQVTLDGVFTSEGVKTSDGTIAVEDLDLSNDSAVNRAYQYADRYDNVNVKNAFMSGIKEGANIEQYRAAFDKMYDSALAGVSYENAKKSFTAVDDDVLEMAYKTGETEKSEKTFKSLAEALGEVKSGKGEVINESSTANADMVDFYSKLARRTGLTFRIVDNMEKANARGAFKVNESEIVVKADEPNAAYHELGEFTETYNKKDYDALRDAIANFASEKMGNDKYLRMMRTYKSAYARAGLDTAADEMSGEMFNDTISIMMQSEKGRTALADYLAKNYSESEAKTIGQQAAEYMRKLGDIVKSLFQGKKGGYEGEMAKYADELGEYADQFIKALDGAIQNYNSASKTGETKFSVEVNEATEEMAIHYDAQDEMVYPIDYSLETWNASEYQTDRKNAAKELAKAMNISQKKALKYIDDINSIAKIIADDRVRLDYESDEGSAVVPNADYGASVDFSTICKKRLLYTGTLQQIQKQIGNRVITVDDYLDIRQAMIRDNKETTCGCCYVEGSRAKLGTFMKEFIKKYAATKPSYVPTMYDVTTPDGIRDLRAKHPEVFEARTYFLNHYGRINADDKALFASQQKPKDYTERKAYKGEILKMFKGKNAAAKVAEKNLNGGFRLQSFSDFEVVNLLDCMQVITDMSRVGLAGQAYTKVKNFADALGNTGLKINCSLMAKDVDKNGNLILDEINGMKKADAEYLRNKYSKNVGTIIVCFTDDQIKAAMKDNFIDFIIPFHRSQWQQSQYEALGLPKNTRDYTNYQEDGVINEKGRRVRADHSFMSKEYWDFSKSGRENAETYINMCNDANKVPVFDFLLEKDSKGKYVLPADADGYFKLLIDFKMYDNDGVGSPQLPVTPNFSLDECRAMLESYEGGHESFPVDQKIADEFTKKITKREKEFKYSINVDSEGKQLTEEQAEYFKDSKIVDENGNLKVMYHGTQEEFYKFDPKKFGGKNGTAEGYGIYLTDTKEVSEAYGGRILTGYANVTHPANSNAKTISEKDLAKLIKKTCEIEAEKLVEDEGYDSVDDAIRDSWVSNLSNTYEKTMDAAYLDAARQYLKLNSNDMDIIQVMMNDQGIRDFESAYEFYSVLTDTLGIDGFVTNWKDSKTGELSQVVVAFNSNQFKNADNLNPTEDEDIRYSINMHDMDFNDIRTNPINRKLMDELKAVSDANTQKEKKQRARHLLRSMLGKEFVVEGNGKKIAFTDDRVERLLKMYAASNKDYGQAYLTYMSPADYLLLTTNGNDGADTLERIKKQSTPLDIEELKSVYDTQPIFLDLAEKGVGKATKNEIVGHEGRHRMYALQLAGFDQIPVLVFNYDNKYSKTPIDSLSVYPQAFSEDVKYNKSNMITLTNLQPLTRGNEDNIKQMFGSGQEGADLRFSIKIDSLGRNLSEGQQKYFYNSQNLTDNDELRVMYHGTEGSGFTVFNPEYSDDRRSLFFTDNKSVAKSYSGIMDVFSPDKALNFKELNELLDDISGGEIYIEQDGKDIVVKELGYVGESDREVLRGSLKEAQTYAIDRYKDERGRSGGNYEVYLNIENPLVIDADYNNWDEIPVPDGLYGHHYQNFEIHGGYDDVFTVDYEDENGSHTETFKTFEDIEKKFGQINENFDMETEEIYIENLYVDEKGNRIPTNTRMYSQYAQENGYDGVIFKNLIDTGVYATGEERAMSSTVAIVFNSEQVKSVNNLNPTSSDDIRYSIGLDDDPFLEFDNYGTREDAKAVEILKEGMDALKNAEVDEKKIRNIATKLRNEYGSTYNLRELTDSLTKAFAYMQTEDHVDYKTMMGILKDIARPVIEASNEVEGKEEYKAFINSLKGYKIRLTKTQKDEVIHSLGSYGAYCKAMMPITISDNGDMTLDQLWDELVAKSGYMLDVDATEGDKALNLLDTLQALRPATRNTYGGDIEDVSKDLAMRIVEEYVGGEVARKMNKQISDYRDQLKKDYDERLKKLKGRANADVLAKNKKKAEQAQERQKVRDLRHAIKLDSKKLMHWIEQPTEGKSVPHDLVVPIVQFLRAFDFVDPDIVMKEDGRWHVKVFDRLDYVNGKKSFKYKDISAATREEALEKFNEAIGRGEGSKEQRFWAQQMDGIKQIYDQVLNDEDFEDNNMDFLMQTLDAEGLARDFDELLSKNKDSLNMNHLSSEDLTLLNNIIKNIFKAVNQGNKAYTMSADVANMAQQTIKESEGKEIPSRNKILEGLHKNLRIDNATPRTFFKLLGSKGIDLYKSMRRGLNTEIRDIKKASDFMEGVMEGLDQKEMRKWTGKTATIHEFALSNGSVKMTDAQIMGLYLTIRRKGGMDRIVGGIKPGDIFTNGRPIRQNAIHLTAGDIKKIESVLTPKQIEIAKKIQQYMAKDCSEQGNDTSLKLYGFKKFTDDTYYPWSVDRDTVATNNTSENIPVFNGIERSGFTKALKPGANNPLVINDVFDVFTDHVSQMAAYHGYAASLKDVLRWMNYREKSEDNGFVKWITNKNAINVLSGSKQGVGYIRNLLLDINKANKSRYVGSFTDALIGNYKAAAVGANLRVVIQQPTAYFRALNMIDSKYLFAVNPAKAIKYIKLSQEESPISWWKAKGYYETNLGQPLKEIVTGITSPTEALKDKLMAPAGWADNVTWGFLYSAVENEQRAKLKGQNLTPEQFRQAVNDRFDDMVDNTQVVDTTLHRSQYMRSTDRLNKIQTAFMAEPTKSYNMVMEALIEDLNDKSMKRTTRAVIAFLTAALATSAAQSVMDVLRKTGDDDDWWESFMQYVKDNFLDNINPFNLLPVLKDVAPDLINAFTGESTYGKGTSRFDIDALSSISDAVSAWVKYIEGNGNKTPYGMVMATIRPISQVTGIPIYNLTRDAVSLYNAFFENIETTVKKSNTARNEKKKEVVKVVDKEKSEDTIRETITQAIENGVSIYDLKGSITSEYKNKYFDAYSEGDMDKAKEIADKAAGGFVVMGLSDEEIDEIINGWQEEAITYSALDKAIADGKGIEEEIAHVQEGKADDKIVEHIMNRFASTVKYEDANNTESEWRENVEKALQTVDSTNTFDSVLEEAEKKAKEKAEKAAVEEKHKEMKQEFFDAVDKKDGSAGRKALEAMKKEGIEGKTVKSAVSTKYHDMWKEATSQAEKDKVKSDWKSAYTLVNRVYGTESKDLDKTWNEWVSKQK